MFYGLYALANGVALQMSLPDEQKKTGWPPGMLQDDSPELSRWLASRPNARQEARQAADSAGVLNKGKT